MSHWNDSDLIDALAAACAEAGEFEEAMKYERQALEDGSISEAEKEEREERLRLFQQHQPYRDELSGTATSAQNP